MLRKAPLQSSRNLKPLNDLIAFRCIPNRRCAPAAWPQKVFRSGCSGGKCKAACVLVMYGFHLATSWLWLVILFVFKDEGLAIVTMIVANISVCVQPLISGL
ncbi:hypothetical protein JTB14_005922 [Gonioctena quinquepunctata]|nr:hypothetical protein JTB14_005922 [Gonioctena quinquepunctata]